PATRPTLHTFPTRRSSDLILAEDSRGRIYNLEIQRKKDIDHARRTRLYGAMVDSEHLEKGKDYDQMPEVYVIYISETNLWKTEQDRKSVVEGKRVDPDTRE